MAWLDSIVNQVIFSLALVAVLEILTYGRREVQGNAVC